MALFHKNRGFLINYLHVLCCRIISIHSQIKSKPILERRMIALVNERHILIITCKLCQKRQNIERSGQKHVFYDKIIGKAKAFSIFVVEGGGASFGSPCIVSDGILSPWLKKVFNECSEMLQCLTIFRFFKDPQPSLAIWHQVLKDTEDWVWNIYYHEPDYLQVIQGSSAIHGNLTSGS